ncbi:radical SAM protein [bacterium]|nr:radical SAM protein [bacterium]
MIPPKTCTYSCVYCQLGRTTQLRAYRESFFPKEVVLAEIAEQVKVSDIDYLTFVGDGEPTLSSDIGWLIGRCKKEFDKPIAVITNGSLLYRDDVKEELSEADVVLPSLDCGSDEIYRRINRPHGRINFGDMISGLIDFRREYTGELWLEVMLVAGINDSVETLNEIRMILDQVEPERVYVATPIRPPAESWVHPVLPERILLAQKILGESKTLDSKETGGFSLNAFSNTQDALIEIGTRHPLRVQQALDIERAFNESGVVEGLLNSKQLLSVHYEDSEYLLPAHFSRKV